MSNHEVYGCRAQNKFSLPWVSYHLAFTHVCTVFSSEASRPSRFVLWVVERHHSCPSCNECGRSVLVAHTAMVFPKANNVGLNEVFFRTFFFLYFITFPKKRFDWIIWTSRHTVRRWYPRSGFLPIWRELKRMLQEMHVGCNEAILT